MDNAVVIASVWLRPEGADVIIGSVKLPAAQVRVSAKALESWCLRKLREEVLQPERTPNELPA
jgi:hypothetical protein